LVATLPEKRSIQPAVGRDASREAFDSTGGWSRRFPRSVRFNRRLIATLPEKRSIQPAVDRDASREAFDSTRGWSRRCSRSVRFNPGLIAFDPGLNGINRGLIEA
jgi:hypothetical protein